MGTVIKQNQLDSAGPIRLHAVLLGALGPGSVAHALTQSLDNLPSHAVDRKLWCVARDPASPHDYDRPAIPEFGFRALCKLGFPQMLQARIASRIALRSIKAGDIVYMWPPYDLAMIKRAQELGAIVVAERTNCMGSMGRERLSQAFGRTGRPLPDGWFAADDIAEERQQMRQCDFVTAANGLVSQSLLDAGIPAARILQTSYGFSPKRLARAMGVPRLHRDPVFAFVGLGDTRKGLDVLLEAWEVAAIAGTLLIAGTIEDHIRTSYAKILARPDVKQLGFVKDIASVYAAADVFVFPTHEEGGPQVVYEAAGCGLASIVSPMGAGRIVRKDSEGLIIDPLKVDEVADALANLAEDKALRTKLGEAALVRAQEFTWAKVGARLYDLFRGLEERQRLLKGQAAVA